MREYLPYLGFIAGTITVTSFLPQVVRTWRTRRTRDLSMGMFALLVASGTLWILYGALTHDLPVVATNVGMVSLCFALVVAKLRYK